MEGVGGREHFPVEMLEYADMLMGIVLLKGKEKGGKGLEQMS